MVEALGSGMIGLIQGRLQIDTPMDSKQVHVLHFTRDVQLNRAIVNTLRSDIYINSDRRNPVSNELVRMVIKELQNESPEGRIKPKNRLAKPARSDVKFDLPVSLKTNQQTQTGS